MRLIEWRYQKESLRKTSSIPVGHRRRRGENMVAVFVFLGILVAVILRHMKGLVDRKSASFKLYAVRDDLIDLVAQNRLSEKSEVFSYYYRNLNIVLERAPNVGIDDAMDILLRKSRSSNTEKSLAEANRNAERMLQLVKNEDEAVSLVIADYYAALRAMILAHSSYLRFLYIVVLKYRLYDFFNVVKNHIPNNQSRILKTLNFVTNEEERFRHAKEI
jgi:hypothetical protein